jgi:hypothetical protein
MTSSNLIALNASKVPIAAAVVSRTCTICGEQFTPAAPAFRALRCSPACRREFKHRYQQDRRASDEGFHERARLDQAARRQARKARREALEIAAAAAVAQPIDSDMAEYWKINHGISISGDNTQPSAISDDGKTLAESDRAR